jgi:16S rRNA (uracil1498-N3)-methyltransferase
MNYLVLLPEELKSNDSCVVIGERARYLTEFHRPAFEVSYPALILNKGKGKAELLEKGNDSYTFKVEWVLEEPNFRPIQVISALSRPHTLKKVLQYSAMFRVREVIFIPAELAEKSYSQSHLLTKNDAIRYELIKGLEQIGSAFPPQVRIIGNLSDLQSYVGDNQLKILADPDSKNILAERLVNIYKNQELRAVTLAIGPEPGWSNREKDLFVSAGYECFSLSEDHYRVEVALVALLAQVMMVVY